MNEPYVPERNKVNCAGCNAIIDAAAHGNAEFVSGWSVNRPKGTNGVALQERHRRWLCRFCLDKRKAHISDEQMELFG